MRRCYVSYMTNDRDIKGILLIKYLLNKYNSKYEYVCLCCDIYVYPKCEIYNCSIVVLYLPVKITKV